MMKINYVFIAILVTCLTGCQTRYLCPKEHSEVISAAHSLKFDNDSWNMGGQDSRHPLDTSKFKWE